GSLYQRTVASLLENEQDVSFINKEWFRPQPEMFICGAGHVAKALAAMASFLDFGITVIDDRDDLANAERFPNVKKLICDSYDNLGKYLIPGAYYVVVTPNHKADLKCVSTILPTDYRYLGMIGSKGKVAATFNNLRNIGFTEDSISTIFAPVGLSIGAVSPAEISVSILAEIIREKNRDFASSADRTLLEANGPGVLCIITEKSGSAPRGVGSMMFVTESESFGSIGGGTPEFLAIDYARSHREFSVKEYKLNREKQGGLDMICGGNITVTFVPVS
ncbi:MAG: XdhC family protein, partial [Clostridia bacterium]|nr:XdhC family protein [Clostridia bacterium]